MSAKALSAAVSEIRLHFCQTGASSAGVREFVLAGYGALKTANPRVPVLIREAAGAEPALFARLSPQGVEKRVSLANLSDADVGKALLAIGK